MKKVCIITAARSEYGLLRWVIDGVYNDNELELLLVVTGAHLSEEHGNTVKFIEEDGYPIVARVDMHLTFDKESDLVRSMGHCSIGFADVLAELKPDIAVVLGDRYELLPIVSAALIMNIPVAHISGGDVTEGAIDNQVRNAVTMMSSLHFPGTKPAYDNICRMIGTAANVYVTGETNIDNFEHYHLFSRKVLSENLNIAKNRKWILVTLHPETKLSLESNLAMARDLMDALQCVDAEIVITQANADFGGAQMNEIFKKTASENSSIYFIPTLGQQRYLSFMKEVECVIGNSSSGIFETPHLGVPAVNIGDRQKGRFICKNVISCGRSVVEISEALKKAISAPKIVDKYWGDGFSSDRIVNKIKEFLNA